jgi:PAS domain S-box-containing protein
VSATPKSGRPLNVLIVEDSPDDAALTVLALKRGGIDPTVERVDTPEAMSAALDARRWDVVVSDYSMPRFNAPAAFSVLREKGLDIPFIIVSGTVGEETAVGAMKLGIHDYLMKGQLARLAPAIERELRDAEQRRARMQAENERKQSDERFRLLVEGVRDYASFVVDLDGRVAHWNSGAASVAGFEASEIVGQPISAFYPKADRENGVPETHLETARRGGRVEHEGWQVRKDGSKFWASVTISAIRSADGTIADFVQMTRDLTERRHAAEALRRTEDQLRQAQKLEAIGSLAGGIAHDFNNVLSVIISCTTLVLDDLKPGDPLRTELEEVKKAADRAVSLTRQLLAFSRKQLLQPRVLDLNQVVNGMRSLLTRLLGESVQLTLLTDRQLGRIHADPGQIEQILMNLIVNARDAMPDGGKVIVETCSVRLDEAYAAQHVEVTPGDYVMLAVTDTGIGMDKEIQSRIFEPFFTTKEPGRGTGLGLATVFGIVKQSEGHIWVYSEPGKGTTFKIHFPRTARTPDGMISEPPAAPATLQGNETILLVEDEDQVRTVMRTILRRQGYNVLEAQNGGEAFLICEDFTAKIHLLITDVVMPRMSGRVLVERLASLRPDLKVLYVSGYTENSVVHHGVLEAGIAFLQKPIMPDALARKVREVLDSPKITE